MSYQTRRMFFCLLASLILIGCNKNSNQLPPPTSPQAIYKIVKVNGADALRLSFYRDTTYKRDSVWVVIEELAGREYKDLKLVLVFCTDTPDNYTNCTYVKEVSIETLAAGGSAKVNLFNRRDELPFSGEMIEAGIVGAEEMPGNLYSGVYEGVYGRFGKGDTLKGYLDLRGYILSDGNLKIELRDDSLKHYFITGRLVDTTLLIAGRLEQEEYPGVFIPLSLDTLDPTGTPHFFEYNAQSKELRFQLKLQEPIADSVDKIQIRLYRK